MPAAVDRPQIVVRVGPNQVDVDEFDRWTSLQNDVARVIAENLVLMLGTPEVTLFPQTTAAGASYRVVISVLRFDSVPGRGCNAGRRLDGARGKGGSIAHGPNDAQCADAGQRVCPSCRRSQPRAGEVERGCGGGHSHDEKKWEVNLPDERRGQGSGKTLERSHGGDSCGPHADSLRQHRTPCSRRERSRPAEKPGAGNDREGLWASLRHNPAHATPLSTRPATGSSVSMA